MTKRKVVRFTAASNRTPEHVGGRNPWYVIDLLTTEAHEKDATKGWFHKRAAAQKAADRLNLVPAEAARTYVRLSNGYVTEAK